MEMAAHGIDFKLSMNSVVGFLHQNVQFVFSSTAPYFFIPDRKTSVNNCPNK